MGPCTRARRGAVLALALAGSGCTWSHASHAYAARTADPCRGVAGCRIVGSADLDGDGVPDRIGLSGHPGESYGEETWTAASDPVLRVALGGRVLTYAVPLDTTPWTGPLYHGAAEVDDRPGREVIVGWAQGMHSAFYTMLTFHDGRVATVRGPGDDGPGPGDAGTWVVEASLALNAGTTCLAPGRVRIDTAHLNATTTKFETTTQEWAWTGSGWRRAGPETRAVAVFADGPPARYQRWHCAGFDD